MKTRMIVALHLCLTLLCCALPGFAQRPGVAKPTRGGPTPLPVLDGSAKLSEHYKPEQMLRLAIGLQQPRPDAEKQFLQELQDRKSPNFQHFLKPEEWNARFAPSKKAEQSIVDWAKSQGLTVTHRYPNRLIVDVEAPVATIEKAFNVTINSYKLGSKSFFSNDRDPVIPASLAGKVQAVIGLNNLNQLHPFHKGAKEPSFPVYSPGPVVSKGASGSHDATAKKPTEKEAQLRRSKHPITNGAYDPTDIYSSEAYDFNALYAQGHCCNPLHNSGGTPPETTIAIATAGAQDGNDFIGFHNQYPYLAMHWFTVNIDGSPACCDGEGTMDFEWSTAMSNSFGSYADTASVVMYDGVDASFTTFTDIYNQMLSDGYARVFSTSWGCAELTCFDLGTMATEDSIFSAMVGQGWTLVAASDDQGATASCVAQDGVEFPASDPNIVGAGGNTLSLDGNSNYVSETGWTGGPYGCGSNDGGSGGGCSAVFGTPSWQTNNACSGARSVPDIALNADWYNTPQNFFFGGALSGNGGTSIVAPEMAGFFAQANAYMDYIATVNGGCYGGTTCAPIGNGNWYLYWFGDNSWYAPHYPFYDITSGCNNNDVTSFYGLGYYCAGTGYDMVTGWGSINALQLSWAINTYRAADFGAPVATFSGPATNHWYNTDQTVSWTLADTGSNGNPLVGVAGFSQAWDSDPGDVFSEATPGAGNSFYSGPQFPNATSGYMNLSWAGQGCHTVNLRAWDNTGVPSGDQTYGSVCYDTIAPVTTASLSGTLQGGIYVSPVKVTLSATDSGSGIASTVYQIDGGAQHNYAGPFTVSATGSHVVAFHSTDVAGNVEGTKQKSFTIKAKTSTVLVSSLNPSHKGQAVTFTATVTPGFGGPANGTVTFKSGGVGIGTATLNTTTHKAKFTTAKLTVGKHSITAVYNGNAHFLSSVSNVVVQVVKP
jgi:hypothetical protein